MADNDYTILQQYKEIDFLFFLISNNSNITEYELKQKFKGELESLNLNDAQIKALLEKLKEDKHIIEKGVEFFVNPLSKNFLGYYHAFVENEYNEKLKEKRANRLNKLSIIANIIFGILTIILTVVTIKSDLENNAKDKQIETLQKELLLLKK